MNIPSIYSAAALLALALLAYPNAANAQTNAATTGPLGYYTFTVPAGVSMWVPGLVTKSDFSGAMTGLTAASPNSTIHQVGAAWTPAQFATAGGLTPSHYVEIREVGASEGLVLDIVSNDSENVVVEGNLGAILSGNEEYSIRAHATLGTLFPGGGGLANFADSARLFFDDGTDRSFRFNGTNWFNTGGQNSNGQIVYPGQGIVFTVGAARSVTIGGNEVSTVKTSPTIVPLYGGKTNIVGVVNPLVATDPLDPLFGRTVPLGLDDPNTPAVVENGIGVKDVFQVFADSIRLFGRTGTLSDLGTYRYNGTNMFNVSGTPSDAVGIPIGSAFTISVGVNKTIKIPSFVPQ